MSDPTPPMPGGDSADETIARVPTSSQQSQPQSDARATLPTDPKHPEAITAKATKSIARLTSFMAFLTVLSLYMSWNSVVTTGESLRQSNLATIYTLSGELTRFDQENPALSKFFDKEARRKPWVTEEDLRKETPDEYTKLWEDFEALDKNNRGDRYEQFKVYMACQRIADFSQLAFLQRDVLPAEDWDTWWNYITDQYDESPLYRIYLAKRARWYSPEFVEAVKPDPRDPTHRAKYYRGEQKLQASSSSKMKLPLVFLEVVGILSTLTWLCWFGVVRLQIKLTMASIKRLPRLVLHERGQLASSLKDLLSTSLLFGGVFWLLFYLLVLFLIRFSVTLSA